MGVEFVNYDDESKAMIAKVVTATIGQDETTD